MKMRLMMILALLLALCIPAAACAYEEELEIVNLDTMEYVEVIRESGTYVARGNSTYGMKIVNDADVVLFLDGVKVNTSWGSPLDCTEAGSVVLVPMDETESEFVSGSTGMGDAGIWNADVPLFICCESVYDEEEDHICDKYCGSIKAVGGTSRSWSDDGGIEFSGAGIGGGMESEAPTSVRRGEEERGAQGSNITILGGNIFARGGEGAAGIGGGNSYSDGVWEVVDGFWYLRNTYCAGSGTNIRIAGGNVEAIGGAGAAGIGGAMNLGLTDGRVIIDVKDYRGGAGENITISGGAVRALGGMMAPGIGGGYLGQGKDITISGGKLYAEACTMPSYENDMDDADMPVFSPVGSGVTFPEDDVTMAASGIAIAPKSGKQIVAKVKKPDSDEYTDLKDTPFIAHEDVTGMLEGYLILATMEEDVPPVVEDVPVVVVDLPSTGDKSGMLIWTALLVLSATAVFLFKRRTFQSK